MDIKRKVIMIRNSTKSSVEAVVENVLKMVNQPAEPRYLQWGCIQEQLALPILVPNVEWNCLVCTPINKTSDIFMPDDPTTVSFGNLLNLCESFPSPLNPCIFTSQEVHQIQKAI